MLEQTEAMNSRGPQKILAGGAGPNRRRRMGSRLRSQRSTRIIGVWTIWEYSLLHLMGFECAVCNFNAEVPCVAPRVVGNFAYELVCIFLKTCAVKHFFKWKIITMTAHRRI